MKHYSAKSIFALLSGILLLSSCIKDDPDFSSAFENVQVPTMTYTWKTNNETSIPPAKINSVTNLPVHPEALRP